MRHVASYRVRFSGLPRSQAAALAGTVRVYRDVVSFLTAVADERWDALLPLAGKSRVNAVEHLVHATKRNPAPAYPGFDERFYKLPSYLRRAAIAEAIGKVSSHRSNLERWEEGGRRGRPPRLGFDSFSFPALYKPSMFSWEPGTLTARVKVFSHGDWVWVDLPLRKGDVAYISRHCAGRKMSNPTLERKGKVWSLRFAFATEVSLAGAPAEQHRVCAVDLGINTHATCCVMEADGTVTARRFISLPVEEDRLSKALGRIKGAQQRGGRKTPRLWAYADEINRGISRKVAREVVDFAALYSCDVVVFEHLDMAGKAKGGKRQRLALWRKREIQRAAESQAHLLGMRFSTVNPYNTSRLAFDGSGRVLRGREIPAERGEYNAQTCMFPSGKLYNCDLNASYNIGARYLVRAILKSLPETERLAVQAKVPGLARRTTCTLSSLISLRAELAAPCAA